MQRRKPKELTATGWTVASEMGRRFFETKENMTSRDFCYWLQGYFEIQGTALGQNMDSTKVGIIKKHLALVFKHEIDPSFGEKEVQEALNKIHDTDSNIKLRC